MMEHYSVLLQECLEGLHIREDGIYVDATLGRGGHSAEILKRCPKGHLYAFDRDAQAIAQSLPRLRAAGTQFTCIHSCFSAMQEKLAEQYRQNGKCLPLSLVFEEPKDYMAVVSYYAGDC